MQSDLVVEILFINKVYRKYIIFSIFIYFFGGKSKQNYFVIYHSRARQWDMIKITSCIFTLNPFKDLFLDKNVILFI